MALIDEKCEPPRRDRRPLSRKDAENLLREIPDWKLKGDTIGKTFEFNDFKESMRFVNRVAGAAEQEGHHPDICISYNRVKLELSTHKIHGLSRNDFILAAKIDALVETAVV